MRPSIQQSLPPMEVTSIDRRSESRATAIDRGPVEQATAVDQALGLLRRAVADCGYTLDALESATGKGRAHIHRVLQGEKPLTLAFSTTLPADLRERYAQLSAEACGFIVVTPSSGDEAVKQFVGGLFGVLQGRWTA